MPFDNGTAADMKNLFPFTGLVNTYWFSKSQIKNDLRAHLES